MSLRRLLLYRSWSRAARRRWNHSLSLMNIINNQIGLIFFIALLHIVAVVGVQRHRFLYFFVKICFPLEKIGKKWKSSIYPRNIWKTRINSLPNKYLIFGENPPDISPLPGEIGFLNFHRMPLENGGWKKFFDDKNNFARDDFYHRKPYIDHFGSFSIKRFEALKTMRSVLESYWRCCQLLKMAYAMKISDWKSALGSDDREYFRLSS